MCYIMKCEWWVTEEWVEVAGSTEKSYKLQNNSLTMCVYVLYIFGFLMVIKLFIIVCLKCQFVILYHMSL